MNLNLVDFLIIVVIGYQTYKGFKKGLVRLVFDLLAMFLSVYIALNYFREGASLLEQYLNLHGQFVHILGFASIWASTFIAFSYIGKIVNKHVNVSVFGPLNILGGIIIGTIKATVFLAVFIVPLYAFGNNTVKNSYIVSRTSPYLEPIIKDLIPENIQELNLFTPATKNLFDFDLKKKIQPDLNKKQKKKYLELLEKSYKDSKDVEEFLKKHSLKK